jgi:hypothetical protein
MPKRLPRPAVLQRFGRLRVLIPEGRLTQKNGKRANGYAVLCICDCGELTSAPLSKLYSGNTASCGCLAGDVTSQRNHRHGKSTSAEYAAWCNARSRCRNQNNNEYHRYGARGITFSTCLDAFDVFMEEVGPKPSPLHSLDRIDTNGNYEPGNIRWATPKEQSRNTRRNIHVIVNGDLMVLTDAARLAGLSRLAVTKRRLRGWPPSRWLEPYTSDVQLVS